MLGQLPLEIFSMVLQNCDKSVLRSICLVSKSFHSIAAPILFRTVTIHALDEEDLSNVNAASLVAFGSPYLLYTKDVIITAKFHRVLRHRCHDYDSNESDDFDELEDTENNGYFDDEEGITKDGYFDDEDSISEDSNIGNDHETIPEQLPNESPIPHSY
ncbi:hypothetical protein N7492_002060 [Penicillium capsulatum]|uniref:F-box domain-containing protein n=1 Tax=Penicillium capsulatum TaxID=69766 RepID=A0A9W9IHW9_9EURO|nr:hypothetical protein N7492_002060 [Penicillium capsulatum]KAJ6123322.1 hypothetical protein N7512_005787 [Penicillium capsulatum]